MSQNWVRRIFILPAALAIFALTIYPLVYSLGLSFFAWQLTAFRAGPRFSGLANYAQALQDPRFWFSLRNTLLFVVVTVVVEYILGMAVALLLNENLRGRKWLRVVLLVPMMLTPVATGYMWRMIFHPTRGPLNHLLGFVGLGPVPWVTEGRWALWSIMLVDVWEWTPLYILVLLSGLQAISPTPYEAARIDGASWWQEFRYITFPMIWPLSTTIMFLRGLEGFKIFDKIFVITGGGPGISTESSTMYIQTTAFTNFNLGYASAMSYLLLLGIVITMTLLTRSARRQQQAEVGL